jgi:hypothetical protein
VQRLHIRTDIVSEINIPAMILFLYLLNGPVPVAARSKHWDCGRSPAEIVGLNLTGGHGCLSVLNGVCCQAEVSATS